MPKTYDQPKSEIVWGDHAKLKIRTLDQQSAKKLMRTANQLADPHNWGALAKKVNGEDNMYVARLGNFRVVFKREDETIVILNIYSAHQ